MFRFKIKNNKGFAILYAVLISSMVLSVGASIISIALRQVTLSGSARDSQYAFYAANTGTECAMYWDLVGVTGSSLPVFATSSQSNLPTEGTDFRISNVQCAEHFFVDATPNDCSDGVDNSNTWCVGETSPNSATTYFRIKNLIDVDYCADVKVIKAYDNIEDRITTTIESRGYNTCDENSRRRVERGLRYTY